MIKSNIRILINIFSIRAPRVYLRGPFILFVEPKQYKCAKFPIHEKTLRGRSGLSPNVTLVTNGASQLRVSTGLSPVSSLKVMPEFSPQSFLSMNLLYLSFIR